jgi:hypothetical protein
MCAAARKAGLCARTVRFAAWITATMAVDFYPGSSVIHHQWAVVA